MLLVAGQSPSLIVFEVTIFVLAIFLGFEVISKVPTMLHTPLMSGHERDPRHRARRRDPRRRLDRSRAGCMKVLGFVAVVLGTVNVVGGFVVTDRMLEMFKPQAETPTSRRTTRVSAEPITNLLYLLTIVCFILGAARSCRSPKTARRGNQIGAVGMVIAIVVDALAERARRRGLRLDRRRRARSARVDRLRRRAPVKMTAMPQMVALFNGVGGGAAALVALGEFHKLAPLRRRTSRATSRIAIVLRRSSARSRSPAAWSPSGSCRS